MRLIKHEKTKDWDLVHFVFDHTIGFEGMATNRVTLGMMNMEHNPNLRLGDGSLVRERAYFYTMWGSDHSQSALGSIIDGTVYVCEEQPCQ